MITSTANRQVKLLMQLNKKRKARDEQGVFLAEGPKMLENVPAERIVKAYFSESWYKEHAHGSAIPDASWAGGLSSAGYEFEVMEDHIFASVSGTETPQGVLLIVKRSETPLEMMLEAPNPLLVVLENLQDPGNLGTILRTAEGAGADGVILCNNCVDLYNPKTVRSTMGSIFRVPVCRPGDGVSVASRLRKAGIHTYAAHLDGSVFYDEADYREGCAFLIGNESAGLSAPLTKAAEHLIKIPMAGGLESLNASVAASILMYEAVRQRRNS